MSSGGPRPDEASLSSSSLPSLGAGGGVMRVVRCFFDLVEVVNAGVDLVHRTIRSADLVLMFLDARGTRRLVGPASFLATSTTDLGAPNGVLVKLIVRICASFSFSELESSREVGLTKRSLRTKLLVRGRATTGTGVVSASIGTCTSCSV